MMKNKINKTRCVMQVINVLCRGRRCFEPFYCDGLIACPWLTPNDEANCMGCPSYYPSRCDCNVEGNFTCEWDGDGGDVFTCFHDGCK